MTLKELLKGRKKLTEYDELTVLIESFKGIDCSNPINFDVNGVRKVSNVSPKWIGIIISALEAEIAKLDEE